MTIFDLYKEVDKEVKIEKDRCSPHCIYLTDVRKYSGRCVLFKKNLESYINIKGLYTIERCKECEKEF